MQPYFLPYLGYWQLLNYVDRFVIYEDVNYIKRGWINRNRILINGEPHYLTVPIRDASQNSLISELSINEAGDWRNKMLRSIDCAYRKSPFFAEVFPVLQEIVQHDCGDLAKFLAHQLLRLSEFIGIDTELVASNGRYGNRELSGQDRLIDICQRELASIYVNAEGGMTLYDVGDFSAAGISLQFLKMNPITYIQRASEFLPNLSIVDVLMALGRDGVEEKITDFALIGSGV